MIGKIARIKEITFGDSLLVLSTKKILNFGNLSRFTIGISSTNKTLCKSINNISNKEYQA